MDAYIPQFKWKKLIEESIGKELEKFNLSYNKQGDNSYYYVNDKIEMIIIYFHKEIGINFKYGNKTIHSSDIISNCSDFNEKLIDESKFDNIEEYFKYLLKFEFSNVEKCLPNVFYGNF